MNKREKQYHKEMDYYEESMFDCLNKNLERIEIQLMHEYKKVRSPIKKLRIRKMVEKKHCIDNFMHNFRKGYMTTRLFYMLFGLDYRYIRNDKLYRDLYSLLSVSRHIYNIDKFPKCKTTQKGINSSNDKVNK